MIPEPLLERSQCTTHSIAFKLADWISDGPTSAVFNLVNICKSLIASMDGDDDR